MGKHRKKQLEKMKRFLYYIQEYTACIAWIIAEPKAIDVEYHFYHMHELEKELHMYVKEQTKEEEEYE